ncbi:DISARM system helicase DrmA [Nocardia sp. R16R-3T]
MTNAIDDLTVESPSTASKYELTYTPDSRSYTARENLVDILDRELLGPANGDNEILETTPDQAYLIGRIAPVRITDSGVPIDEDTNEPDTDVGDDVDAQQNRGVPVTAVDDSSTAGDEDSGSNESEDAAPKRGLVIPASMGLRFQIPADLDTFTVTASWGQYKGVPRGEYEQDAEQQGSRKTPRFQRTPFVFPAEIQVADLHPGETMEKSLRDTVVLRLDSYQDKDRLLVEVALCNDRETGRHIPTEAWLYQTKLEVEAGGADVFLPASDPLTEVVHESDDERARLNLQYRKHLEYAVGRTCSVDWQVDTWDKDQWDTATRSPRARKVWTTWLPVSETPQTTAGEVDALLDMVRLGSATKEELRAGLQPIVSGYAVWLDGEEQRAKQLPPHLQKVAFEAVADARKVHQQLADGLFHLLTDDIAVQCFGFMNRVMAAQRIHSQIAERRAKKEHRDESIDEARAAILAERKDKAHSWRTFQLAFILMQLPMLTDPTAQQRSGSATNSSLAQAQLLFFPTGGGKTEAYLGLAAYTFAVRRRQGIVDSADGPLNGMSGVAVLMRYTLRLLTAQQFQRATALVCAAEMERRSDENTWGAEPFRIGLWVGTQVSPKWFEEARDQLKNINEGRGHRLTVLQIQRCPWCGNRIDAGDVKTSETQRRVRAYCSDDLAECPFSQGGAVDDGLPVLTVDEEIYRLAPAFVIATVDKFARLAREGEAAALFGYVSERCDRHGYVHPDYKYCALQDGNRHNAKAGQPAAARRPVGRLRPPDLVIQDELHLITGALGTTVGLFEAAIDVITAWKTPAGAPVRPLLVASTATAFRAADQVGKLYGRDVTIFPPQVLDAGDTFFSKEELVSEATPGRRYLGISTTGVRVTTAEIRIAEVLMAAGQLLLDRSGSCADPYMTLVGYFNATRELAGMARYLGDDVQTMLRKGRPWSRLPRRFGTGFDELRTAELTARVGSADITKVLDTMAVSFDPALDATGAKGAKRDAVPYDAVLATSMLQVGVDVTRLGLMLIVGQPKNTAEYIQASSRVGRDPDRPGLVVTLGNWARPRDLAHFEQFRQYHETFYSQVEALSVTPYSSTAMARGIDGVLISAARVRDAVRKNGLSPDNGAGKIDDEYGFVKDLIELLVERMKRAARDEKAAQSAADLLGNRLDRWTRYRAEALASGKTLSYDKGTDSIETLLISPDRANELRGTRRLPPFEVANSMREVQPEINLLVSPLAERLEYVIPAAAPRWEMPEAQD